MYPVCRATLLTNPGSMGTKYEGLAAAVDPKLLCSQEVLETGTGELQRRGAITVVARGFVGVAA